MSSYSHNNVVPYAQSQDTKRQQVENMFDEIAPRYDFLNRLMSFRIDVLWRKKVLSILKRKNPENILDIATGTADLAIMLSKINSAKITGVDISKQMLAYGQKKIDNKKLDQQINLQQADAENLPFNNESFGAVTVAFGVRNFANLDEGLRQIHRVLSKEGTCVILEFSKVKKFPIKQLYGFYFRYITPALGKMFSAQNAYQYLPNSVSAFPEGKEMISILHNIGFKKVECTPLSFGIASIYTASK